MPDLTFAKAFDRAPRSSTFTIPDGGAPRRASNSITNYERGEGKPHASVLRMFICCASGRRSL